MSPRPDMHTAGTACRRHPNHYHRQSNHYNCRSIHYNRQSNHCQTNHSSPYYLPGRRAHRRRARRRRARRRRGCGCESVRLRSFHGIPGPFPQRSTTKRKRREPKCFVRFLAFLGKCFGSHFGSRRSRFYEPKNAKAANRNALVRIPHPRGFRLEYVKWFFVRRGRSEKRMF